MSKELITRPRLIGSLCLSAALVGGLATLALQASRRATAERHERSARFVVTVGGVAYVRLTRLGEDELPVWRRQTVVDGGVTFAVAEVEQEAVPAAALAWRGATVIADETCRATAGEVVVISHVAALGYDSADTRRTRVHVEEYGERFLAVRLDGCAGAELAREATAPRIIYPEVLSASRLQAAAEHALLASPAAAAAEREWAEFDQETSWRAQLKLDVRVLRHPTTGATTVVAFAINDVQKCVTPRHALLGVFAVSADGELVPGPVRAVDQLRRLERVLDLDGDGAFELTGRPWQGMDRLWLDGAGNVLERLDLPFYGSPC
ncbi:MAG: hypothetical protein R3B48_03355 [Kofleriaceae bacterium]